MMKRLRLLRNFGMILACSGMLSVGVVKAQTVITVAPGLNTLSDALTANPGATLLLQREGDYAVTGTMVINVATIIKGETEPVDARPALVSYSALPGEGEDKQLFKLGASCTLQNFGIIGYTDDGQHLGAIFACTAPDISVTIDGCNIQGARVLLETGQDGLIIVQKNNIIFNNAGNGWDNFVGLGTLWGNEKGDFKCYNNTFFTAGRILNFGGGGPDGSESMEHNSYVNCWGDTYYPIYNKTVKVKNNIFFNTQMRGYVGVLKNGNDTTWAGDFNDWQAKEIPKTDILAGDCPVFINTVDTLADGTPNPVHRQVNITNNLKIYDKTVLDFYAANPIIVKQPFMPATMKTYATKYSWNIKGNLLEEEGKAIDPMFAMGAIPAGAFEMAFKTRLNRHLPTAEADPAFPFEIAWRPGGQGRGEFIWPMPFDFKPTNKALYAAGDDGFPLGDLNWFAPEVKAAWETKKPNPLITSAINIKNESTQSAYIAHDVLKFKGFDKAVDAEVYSILGHKVLVAKNINELNVSSLIHGVYLVRVNNGSQAFRVVK